MKTYNSVQNTKKFFFFTLTIYLLLFISEILLLVFSSLSHYVAGGGKYASFSSRTKEIFLYLKYDLVLYFLAIVLIYAVFALINYEFFKVCLRGLSRRKLKITGKLVVLIFLTINAYFILSLFLVNYHLYPESTSGKIIGALIPRNFYPVSAPVSILLFGLYFFVFFLLSLRHSRKAVKIPLWSLLAVIFISYLNPVYEAKNIYWHLFERGKNEGPNVIIVGLDSVVPEHTGYFGYSRKTTPSLDRFMKENIIFTQAYTPMARTFPSWISILSGHYPRTNGVRYNLIKKKFVNPETPYLGRILEKELGYFTAHFTDETRFSNILPEHGFGYLKHPLMGIKDFVFGYVHDFILTNVFFNSPLGHKIFRFLELNRGAYHLYNGKYFADELLSFLPRAKKKNRFLLAAHFCGPHWPYSTAVPYPFLFAGKHATPVSDYDGAVRMVDRQLGRLLKGLKRYGLYENSLIIVLSDHGESLDLPYLTHGNDLRRRVENHIVMALKLPGRNKHQEIDNLVSTVDIAPTVLDFLSIESRNYGFDGKSLMPLIKGEAPHNYERSVILETGFSVEAPGQNLKFNEMVTQGLSLFEMDKKGLVTVVGDFHQSIIAWKQRSILTSEWQLILEPITDEKGLVYKLFLYNIKKDPACRNNLINENHEKGKKLLEELADHYKEEIDIEQINF